MPEAPPEYPHWLYQVGRAPVLVRSEAQYTALDGDWFLTPQDAAAAAAAAVEETPAESEPAHHRRSRR